MAHYDVIIATPGHSMYTDYVDSLTKTIKELEKKNISWKWITSYCSYVSLAREYTFDKIGNDTYNKLFWIDSDMSWEPEDFISLYEEDKDIVTGVYLTTAYEIAAYKKDIKPVPRNEIARTRDLIELIGCGFGFVCIKYGINESMSKPLFREISISDMYIHAEDASWCLRAASHGYKIWLNPKVRVRHHKTMTLEWRG